MSASLEFLRVALFAIFILVAAAARAQTPAAGEDEMFRCQSYSECMIVWGGCGDVAINKRYAKLFKPSPVCTSSAPHNPKAVPTCSDGRCVAVAPPSGSDAADPANAD